MPLIPKSIGTKGKPSAVPPAFTQTDCVHFSPDNGGDKTVLLSQTAPGRTKRHASGRLSADDRPSLGYANTLFSHSTHLSAEKNLYHIFLYFASEKLRQLLDRFCGDTKASCGFLYLLLKSRCLCVANNFSNQIFGAIVVFYRVQ